MELGELETGRLELAELELGELELGELDLRVQKIGDGSPVEDGMGRF